MKPSRNFLFAVGLLLAGTSLAQTRPASGTIAYETMRRMDLSSMRININGQEVRPGSTMPNGRTFDVPETMEGAESYRFAGQWAMREPMERRNRMFMRGPGGPGGEGGTPPTPPSPEQMRRMEQGRNFRMPFEETTHTDLTSGKTALITAFRVDSTRKTYYQSEQVAVRPADWAVTGKTKKLLGYTCQKATCTIKEQPCTVWFTTELPYTFSPAPSFTPDKGVVLLIESDDLLYRATKIAEGTVNEADLKPNPAAKPVTKEELTELRKKAMASMRQQNGMRMEIRE